MQQFIFKEPFVVVDRHYFEYGNLRKSMCRYQVYCMYSKQYSMDVSLVKKYITSLPPILGYTPGTHLFIPVFPSVTLIFLLKYPLILSFYFQVLHENIP